MKTKGNTIIKQNNDLVINTVVILIIVLGAYLRLHQLDKESIRLDEAQSIWQASHSLEFIRNYMAQNVHLPLHNSLLHLWMRIFGASAMSVRVLSAIPGILSLPAIYLLSKEILANRKKAIMALTIASISPFWIWYSREIRMYTLLTLVSTLSYYFFLKIIKESTWRNVATYTLINLVGIYTHYFFSLVLLVQVVYFLILWRTGLEPRLKYYAKSVFKLFVASAIVLILAFLPWAYFQARNTMGGNLSPDLKSPSSFNIVLSLFEFTLGYQPENTTAAIIALWPLTVLIGFVFLKKRKDPLGPGIYLAFLGAFSPIVIVYVVSLLFQPMYLTRYLISSTPLYYILLAWLLMEMRGRVQYVVGGMFFAGIMLSLHNQVLSPDIPTKENYREAVEFVNNNSTNRDVVVVSPPYTLYPVYYYYNNPSKLISMPVWDRTQLNIPEINDERLKEDSTMIQQGHKRIFLIATLDLAGGYTVQNYLDLNYTRLEKHQFSKFVWVSVYQAEYPSINTQTASKE
ncbi:MAG: Membrane protein-like protein [candidate division WWE3 bacterium GW2011_GWA1_41_8]|uniref:Membrane protein-like protein n=2 Tax=Katanobacteria TaxID=422282 RepID=A0A0G0XED1_UNCKA|nr:MAG: Membrane protein-like protein [candidate division WWE3 bacterium GW2011_GWB1_41_6]KKS22802.1 MAG: Membrane protein-like protein [candidate division WWE3 bacterium GW2011_GWA1_41_8]